MVPSAYRTISWSHSRQMGVPLTDVPVLNTGVYVLTSTELEVLAFASLRDESITVPAEL